MRQILTLAASLSLAVALAACGNDDAADADVGATTATGVAAADAPRVVVTTNILGDVVLAAFGSLVDVEVIMPAGADPHEFAASAKQATAMQDADLLVVNGAGFEAGLDGIIDTVTDSGTPVFAVADHVTLLDGAGHADEEHKDEEHADEEHADEEHADEEHADEAHADEEHADEEHKDEAHADEEHDHGANDPHLWTDPTRIADAVDELADEIGALPGVDTEAATAQATAYIATLTELDAEIEATLATIAPADRVIVTNHEVFGYFADRYDFTVAGAIVPSLTTNAESSAKELEELAELLRARSIRVIFAETTQSTQLAEALATEVGGEVEIVELFTESLGEPGSGADTYLGMMRTNAQLIADALASNA